MVTEEQREKFLIIRNWMRTDLKLRGHKLNVYAVIFGFSKEYGEFSGTANYICEFVDAVRSTVMKCLKELTEDNLVIKIDKIVNGVKLCSYKINKDKISGLSKVSENRTPPVLKSDTPVRKSDTYKINENIEDNITKEMYISPDSQYIHKEKDSTISSTVLGDSQIATNIINKPVSNSNIDYSFYQDKWNEICTSLPKCTIMSDKRKKAVKACLNVFSEEKIIEAFRMAEESDFLSGRNGAWNGCGIDWVLVTGNMTKVLEGNYKNKTSGGHPDMATSTDYSQYVEVIQLG